MDELVHHCLRELSFDGDLGCDVSRLRDFVIGFYEHRLELHTQVVDDAFYAFVWSIIVQQSTVRIGTVPPGTTSQVYIAPQTSAMRKAKAKGEEHVVEAAPRLDTLPDAKMRSLDELKALYGERLRIAVDPETLFAAITGSHLRPPKLSPMVYTALQFITRGREDGISVVDLGKQSKYDQKTCFYLIKQLVELDLIVKVRRGGVGSHFCIHKYFFERSELWQQIRDEETKADNPIRTQESQQQLNVSEGSGSVHKSPSTDLHFDPIDARHLSSLPLVRARVVKLLKTSKNYMHASNNLLITLGFSNPTKTDRRFFSSRIRELIQQGIIEKVVVPSNRRDNTLVKCLRLVTADSNTPVDDEGVVVQRQDGDEDDTDLGLVDTVEEQNGLKMNLTIHKQISNMLEEAGTKGMTLNEISNALGHFDKRTVELLLTRAEKCPPPSHLSDLGTAELMETYGRERRHRYYTVASFQALVAQENLDQSSTAYAGVDLSEVGSFAPITPNVFYEDESALHVFQDTFKDEEKGKSGKTGKRHTKDSATSNRTGKNVKPRKKAEETLVTTQVAQDNDKGNAGAKRGKKRKREDNDEDEEAGAGDQTNDGIKAAKSSSKVQRSSPPKKRRAEDAGEMKNPKKGGRSKQQLPDAVEAALVIDGAGRRVSDGRGLGGQVNVEVSVPKQRGRPPKRKPEDVEGAATSTIETDAAQEIVPVGAEEPYISENHSPRKRGRPRKPRPPSTEAPTQSNFPTFRPTDDNDERPAGAVVQAKPSLQRTIEAPTIGHDSEHDPAITIRSTLDLKPRRSLRKPKPLVKANNSVLQKQTSRKTRLSKSLVPPSSAQSHDAAIEDAAIDGPRETELRRTTSPSASALTAKPALSVGFRRMPSNTPELEYPEPVVGLEVDVRSETVARPVDLEQLDDCIPIDPALLMDDTGSQTPLDQTSRNGDEPGMLISLKRGYPDAPSSTPPPKRLKEGAHDGQAAKSTRTKVNVSHLRRENELFRVIEGFGGIVNVHSKEFFDAHMALIAAMTQAGEATSTPTGTRLDKRTADGTLAHMESKGRIKLLKTSVLTPTGVSRPACVVYLADAEQDKVNTFLMDLGRGVSIAHHPVIKKIEARMDYGSDRNQTQRAALPLQLLQMEQPGENDGERWSRNAARAEQLFSYDDTTIREVLLAERTTFSQLYGFVVGKATRLRQLHISTLSRFEQGGPSPGIVSNEQRIVHSSYFYYDLPIATHCSLVSSLVHHEELTRFLETKEGRDTPMRDIPSKLHALLQVGRARTRARFLDLFEVLRSIKLITPLTPSISDAPWVTCTPNGEYPTAFDVISSNDWNSVTPLTAPLYWCFNTEAPLYLWALSETSPPFWKDVPVLSSDDAVAYWQELKFACTNRVRCEAMICPAVGSRMGPLDSTVGAARSLRREVSWNTSYMLTWHQTQYLKRYIDASTGCTPLQDDAWEPQIQKICWVISAPQDVVCNFFTTAREKVEQELGKAHRRKKRRVTEDKAKKSQETKVQLAKRAAEAKAQREKDWEGMVHRVHPEPLRGSSLMRVRRVRARFLQSGSGKDATKWEEEISSAIREAALAATKLAKRTTASKVGPTKVLPPPIVSNPPEKTIQALIAGQGPTLPVQQSKPKRKRKGKDQEHTESCADDDPANEAAVQGPLRRHRFSWNRDYDELARDASAIIKARCRNLSKLDLSALEQVFPAVPRNSVRQRVVHMRETPGTDAYLKRLEDRWHELWLQHRGTELLIDDDIASPSNFDLIKHIEFLRRHVDKNALRVGFIQVNEATVIKVPRTIDELQQGWDVIETVSSSPTWDFMWNTTVEEGREKNLLRQAFTTKTEEMHRRTDSDLVCVAESALKMAFGTPNDSYDPDVASRLLHDIGENTVSVATSNLLSRGVLSKLVRDPQKSKPGRTLKISDINQNAIGGSIPRDTFQDALALGEISSQQEEFWREWPLLASDGDMAALIQLASDDKVEFKVDTSQARAARPTVDWNSKKADDDQIETAMQIRFRDLPGSGHQSATPLLSPNPTTLEIQSDPEIEHGKAVTGNPACCRKYSEGFTDCLACLIMESTSFVTSLHQGDQELATGILTFIQAAGSKGVTKEQLLTNFGILNQTRIVPLVCRMVDAPVPLLFWTGYTSLVLVSAEYLQPWTVVISQNPMTRIFPRRWFDITGTKIADIWDAALKAVMGVLTFRPGISQTELRWRLRSVYDRQEVSDILQYLEEEGYAQKRIDPQLEYATASLLMPGDKEEMTFWFVGEVKCWYQVS